jgi:hypothetical protein
MIYVETGQGEEGRRRRDDLTSIKSLFDVVTKEFSAGAAEGRVQLNYLEGDKIVDEAVYRHSLGLGPDLVVSSMRNAIELKRRGFTQPLRIEQNQLDEIHPLLRRGSNQSSIIPAAVFPHVACYNAMKVPSPPASKSELLKQASSGLHVGLTFDTANLFWLGAGEESRAIITRLIDRRKGEQANPPVQVAELQQLSLLLEDIQGIRLQKNITFYQNLKDLDRAFDIGAVDWIPCSGPSLRAHSRRMKSKLGVTPLPGKDPSIPAISLASQKVWTLGPHSSSRQREMAEKFVSLAMSRAIQKDILLSEATWFPINERVIIPTEQGRFYIPLEKSLKRALLIESSVEGSAARRTRQINQIIQDVVYGFATPRTGAKRLLEIHDKIEQ